MHEALVISLSTPVLVGVYEDGKLIESICKEGMSSEILAEIFEDLMQRYTFKTFIYANGPGSFMGIKVTYLFLKTLSVVKKIPLLAADAFIFNENSPIKAVGKLYFVKNSKDISMEPISAPLIKPFTLPLYLSRGDFSDDNLPFYGIDAVG